MSKKRVVVSLGHDALGYTTTEQWDAVKVTAKALADLVEADYQLTITHSNSISPPSKIVKFIVSQTKKERKNIWVS